MSPRIPGRGSREEREARRARAAERERRRRERQGYSTAEWDSLPTGEQQEIPPEDDWMRPASRPAPERRRPRHRDLPARVRRRQDIALIVIALVVVGGIYLLFFRGGEEGSGVGPKRLVGQTIIAKMGKAGPDRGLLRRVKRGQVGGVISLIRNSKGLESAAERLQKAAEAGGSPPVLIMVDQEGGIVKRLSDGPPETSAANLGVQGADAAKAEGQKTGEFLVGAGANVDLAPVLDLSSPDSPRTIRARTFGSDSATVSEVGTAFAEGLAEGGAKATAKHFPGLGLAPDNTDFEPVTIDASLKQLQPGIAPFASAIDSGIALVMTSNAVYPAFGSDQPASMAEPIVTGELRDQLGFDGVVITDDLQTPAITSVTSPDRAAVRAIGAGVDMVMFASSERGSRQAFNRVLRASQSGKLDSSQLQDAYDRITSLKDSLGG